MFFLCFFFWFLNNIFVLRHLLIQYASYVYGDEFHPKIGFHGNPKIDSKMRRFHRREHNTKTSSVKITANKFIFDED